MNATDPIVAARTNVLETYVSLVRATPGAQVHWDDGFVWASGPSSLSYCNFVGGFDLASDTALERALERLDRRDAWLFTIDGDRPVDLEDRLSERGLIQRNRLVQMWSDREPGVEPLVTERALGAPRRAVSTFIAAQFFWKIPPSTRTRIAEATATTEHRLDYVAVGGRPTVAMMLVESEDALGLYNLCVREDLRGRGLGAQAVATALAAAREKGVPLLLQCDAELEDWYKCQGFRTFGAVRSWTRPLSGEAFV